MNIPLNIDLQQILLHFFNFSLLTGGLYLLLYQPVKSFMAKREEHYRALDEAAQDALRQAEDKLHSADERLSSLDTELKALRENAAQEAAALAEHQRAEADAQAKQLLADARAEAERERRRIMDEANREAVAIAEDAMDKLLAQRTGEAYDRFLDSVEGAKGA